MNTIIFILVNVILLLIIKTGYKYNNNSIVSRQLTTQLKGVAILLVIIGHMSVMNFLHFKAFDVLGGIGVDIFLFLSGYGIYKSYLKNGVDRTFIIRRFSTIYMPYVFIVAIETVLYDLLLHKRYSIGQVILCFTGFDINRVIDGSMWYISFIILWYIVFIIVYRYSKQSFFNVILMCVFAYLFSLSDRITFMASLTGQYSVHFLAFPLGVALATYEHKIIGFFDENMHKLLLIICTISSLISFLIYHYSGAYSYVFTLSSAVVVILLGIFLQKKSIISRYLDLFGRYSYEIYLVELQVLWYLKVSSFIKYPPLVNLFILIECLVIAIVVNKIIKFLMKFNKGFKGKVSSN